MSELMFYMHDGPGTFRFELSGSLAGVEVSKLEQAWRTASSTADGKVLAVDVTFLDSADRKGRELLLAWWEAGAHFVANSPVSRGLVESITGRPYSQVDAQVGPTFDPRFTAASLRALFAGLLLLAMFLFPATVSAADDASAVLERYSARLADTEERVPMLVEIEASVPRLDKRAHVEAIRRWTDGRRAYQFVSVEGDLLVRKQMIARYIAVDTEAVPMAAAISKANYKFRFLTTRDNSSVFQITPRKKRLGMIEGQLWIDSDTGRVTHLEGRLLKVKSIFVRGIEMRQDMNIREGARETHLYVNTRLMGRTELTIFEAAYAGGSSVAAMEDTGHGTR